MGRKEDVDAFFDSVVGAVPDLDLGAAALAQQRPDHRSRKHGIQRSNGCFGHVVIVPPDPWTILGPPHRLA